MNRINVGFRGRSKHLQKFVCDGDIRESENGCYARKRTHGLMPVSLYDTRNFECASASGGYCPDSCWNVGSPQELIMAMVRARQRRFAG